MTVSEGLAVAIVVMLGICVLLLIAIVASLPELRQQLSIHTTIMNRRLGDLERAVKEKK